MQSVLNGENKAGRFALLTIYESEEIMRLIDADALMESLAVDPIACMGCPEPEFLEELSDILDCAPTVETKEIHYYDDKENCWKAGKIIVENA